MKQEILKNMTVVVTDSDFLIDSDGPLLASFVKHKVGNQLLDLCTGNGIVPLWLIDRGFSGEVVALDIQQQAVSLLKASVKINRLNNLLVIQQDLRGYVSEQKYDIICCNPPYFDLDTTLQSPNPKRRISRSSGSTIKQVTDCVTRNLKADGRFYCCFPASRMKHLFSVLYSSCLNPTRIQLVRYTETHKPWLLLLESAIGSKENLQLLPDIIVERNGHRNPYFDDIYRMGLGEDSE
ncbi:MAG: methyltransferase [Oscillospiraceae bacterium]|nr:methyltransferase [Oscillospiraceae bacterium]